MAKVAVDENGEVLAVWNDTPRVTDLPPGGEVDLEKTAPRSDGQTQGIQAGPRIGLPDMSGEPGITVIDAPEHDRDSFTEQADKQAGGRAGRMWLKNKTVEAEPAGDDPETAIEGALLGIRRSVTERGQSPSGGANTLRVDDIDRAIERERGKGRSRGRPGGHGR